MADNHTDLDPSTWDPALDAVVAAPKHHKVVFENERLRVLEVTLEPNDEEPIIGGHQYSCSTRSSRRYTILLQMVLNCLQTEMSCRRSKAGTVKDVWS